MGARVSPSESYATSEFRWTIFNGPWLQTNQTSDHLCYAFRHHIRRYSPLTSPFVRSPSLGLFRLLIVCLCLDLLRQDSDLYHRPLSIGHLLSYIYNHIAMQGFLRAAVLNRSTLNLAAPRHFLVGRRRMSVRPMILDSGTSPTRGSTHAS